MNGPNAATWWDQLSGISMNFMIHRNTDALKEVRAYQIVRGEGGLCLNLLPCVLGTRVGKDARWKVLLMFVLSSRGLLTSVPAGYGAVQRSCTWVSSCEHTSERPLEEEEGKLKTELM